MILECPRCGLKLAPDMKYGKRMCQVCGCNIRDVWQKYDDEKRKIQKGIERQRARRAGFRFFVAIVFSIVLIVFTVIARINLHRTKKSIIELEPSYRGTLAIGSKTESGGTIIYDKGNYEGGWRYLECSEPFAKDVIWGIGSCKTEFNSEIGSGDVNTWKIINIKGMDSAAGAAFKYEGGTNGWYLPNEQEGLLISKITGIKSPFWCSQGDGVSATAIIKGKAKSVEAAHYNLYTNTPKPSGMYIVAIRKF